MAKPSVTQVKDWYVAYDSATVQLAVGTAVVENDYWKVVNKVTGKKKYFYGEYAWADSRREASDIDFEAYSAS
jgi:hypothetical protein